MSESRLRVIVAWALSILLFVTFMTIAPPKILGQPGWVQRFGEWGYSPRFAAGIGMTELVAAALLLWPAMAAYGAALLSIVLVGAVITHVTSGLGSPVFAGQLLLVASALAALRYPDAHGRDRGTRSDQRDVRVR